MSRYIDADKLQEVFKELHSGKRSLLIDTEPTADVVEVVRCKDCKYWRPDTRPEGSLDKRADGLWGIGNLCIKHLPSDQLEAIEFNPDDYCKYGKRKEHEHK